MWQQRPDVGQEVRLRHHHRRLGDFPENEIIAEIYAQALEAKGVKVKKKLNIGAREVYIPALKNGEIDLLPEYSGNLLTYLDPKATATSEADIEEALDDALPDNLEVLDAAKAEDKDSLNVTPEFAAKNGLKTIADLKKVNGLKLGANPEFKDPRLRHPGSREGLRHHGRQVHPHQ